MGFIIFVGLSGCCRVFVVDFREFCGKSAGPGFGVGGGGGCLGFADFLRAWSGEGLGLGFRNYYTQAQNPPVVSSRHGRKPSMLDPHAKSPIKKSKTLNCPKP